MFEIRVGILGYVSVGKTTVINALFGEEFGEVAMKRTTAVVNSFRIGSEPSSLVTSENSEDDSDDSVEVVTKKLSASVTLKETASDNATFRNSNTVKQKTFDIALQEPLHKMRPDTQLVVVDIPGLNEAGTSSKYKDYVTSNWHTFDIVVVVMDARQGVNTEEQLDLLRLVKNNLSSSKDMPVIILGNKVDDPDNKEQRALLDEARTAIAKVFGVSDREKALETLLDSSEGKCKSSKGGRQQVSLFPAVVPISAMHAFVYRCGSHLSFEEFCKMDSDFIDKIGKDSYGRQWKRFGKKKKQEKAYQAVSEDDQCKDGVEASNFDTFVKVLSRCIGDKPNQMAIIEHQVDVALKRMKQASPTCDLGAELLAARSKLKALGKPVDHLPDAFWASYKKMKRTAFNEFKKDFSPKHFAGPISQLHGYYKALLELQWPGEMQEAMKNAKELALKYAVTVTEADEMKKKSQSDQSLILGSMLLYSGNDCFSMHFGFLKLYLESKKNNINAKPPPSVGKCYTDSCQGTLHKNPSSYGAGVEYCGSCGLRWVEQRPPNCPLCITASYAYANRSVSQNRDGSNRENYYCNSGCYQRYYLRPKKAPFRLGETKMNVENGKLVPVDKKTYKEHVTADVPETLKDPNHFGHVFWKCCELLKDADQV